ncbi:HNH endonuclease [Saccharobesus litoralis]|uniref:HNH endonuclease n=1 Tax=Saccharobesus litoralis TaxID=2172099 RepID=A0A2S0VNX0_9ALTE|nr:HNH endonuclease [Saccharobesus litoralis]AWB65882.1 HNH endonuclease [Saccharobesus litoralis]
MKISESSVHFIYNAAKNVYDSKRTLVSAAKEASDKGLMSDGSARIYINIFRSLMKGVGHTRAMNEYSTIYFLESIYKDYGLYQFELALQATAHHVNYYNSLGKGRRTSIEKVIADMKTKHNVQSNAYSVYPDEVEFIEGKVIQTYINKYERSASARQKAIVVHGVNCIVCDFNFEEMYGSLGTGFIHIHHLIDLSEIGSEYSLNVETDLVPVCPNCHAMLHKTKPAMKPEKLKEHLTKRNNRTAII